MLIHPSHKRDVRQAVLVVGVLLFVLLLALGLPDAGASWIKTWFVPLHTSLELVSIVVAGLVFGVVWGVRREHPPQNLVVLGMAFLGVALLDFTHVMSSRGMPDFITPYSVDKAVFFWLGARLMAVLALLGAAWLPRHPSGKKLVFVLFAVMLASVLAVHLVYFLMPAWMPKFFVPGQPVPVNELVCEYILLALALVAALRLFRLLREPRSFHVGGLLAVACILVENSFFFVSYSTVTGLYIVLGHVFKLVAYLFLFHTVFVDAVRRPYALLHDSRTQLRATMNALPDLIFEMDAQGRYLEAYAGRPEELSDRRENLIGKTVGEVMPAHAAETVLSAIREAGTSGHSRGRVIALDIPSGGKHWFELSVSRKDVDESATPHFVVISRDVTSRQHVEQDLLKLSSVVSQSPQAVVISDLNAHVEYVNEAFVRMLGYAPSEAAGRIVTELLHSERNHEAVRQEIWSTLRQGHSWHGEIVARTRDGDDRMVSALVYPLCNASGAVTHYIAHLEDLTEMKRAAERIQRLANFDQLTGLPNRIQLEEYFRRAAADGRSLAVLWIDIDHFKDVNDSLGHHVGDQLLLAVARRLHMALREQDTLSRLSGDKFVVLMPEADHAQAARVAQTLLQVAAHPLALAEQRAQVSLSVGIAMCPEDADGFLTLLKSAEIAMYRTKDEGRNGYRFFKPDMQQKATHALALGNSLKQALQNGELSLVYQPQLSLADGRIIGTEALLRWNSPSWGAVPPTEFIPMAESLGLIVPIGDWVLQTALTQSRQWARAGMDDLVMAVNLSAVHFNQPGLAVRIRLLLDAAGVPAENLELELTEAVAMQKAKLAARRIEELVAQGIRISIDDFGTGYSSLSYLKQFKANKLKIDQSFVSDINVDPDDQAIVVAIIQLARSLGLRTIAEGVETIEQLDFLRTHGCDEIQGYYFAQPMPPEDFETFVKAHPGGGLIV